MKLLARAENLLQASIWYGSLRAAGITCELRNTTLAGAIGEIPFLECAPQLWLRNPLDEPRARELIAQLRRPVEGASWACAGCGELLEPQFSQCWNCGAGRP